MPGFTKIPFAFAAVSVAKDGVVTVDWPNLQDLDNPPSSYLLCDTPFDQGKRQDQEGSQDIEVTDFNLGVEVIEAGAGPSIASGFSLEQYKAVHEEDKLSIQEGIVVWLFEPSQESTVLADIQIMCATAIKADGEGIEVLFDMMAHTLDGSSGVGDHGKSGIKTFLQKHKCGNRCRYLRLSCDGFAHSLDSTDEEETE
ncbi:hypothetical protein DFH08DRAFT_945304 [Mycena albidolilacea]|uniref:Alpha-type protein kinase domain-containing protein n=1 Tax=Mycena albidolilacea TaxID=1033008 RepID=A0AAD7E8T8_9AGAR|nr:hypothetical protein DFH08DRAFT_945304 [Mycena albidolilacea]